MIFLTHVASFSQVDRHTHILADPSGFCFCCIHTVAVTRVRPRRLLTCPTPWIGVCCSLICLLLTLGGTDTGGTPVSNSSERQNQENQKASLKISPNLYCFWSESQMTAKLTDQASCHDSEASLCLILTKKSDMMLTRQLLFGFPIPALLDNSNRTNPLVVFPEVDPGIGQSLRRHPTGKLSSTVVWDRDSPSTGCSLP